MRYPARPILARSYPPFWIEADPKMSLNDEGDFATLHLYFLPRLTGRFLDRGSTAVSEAHADAWTDRQAPT